MTISAWLQAALVGVGAAITGVGTVNLIVAISVLSAFVWHWTHRTPS